MTREHKKIERFMLFSEVAKELSFTKAAARLNMSRGYLSDQIKQLEKDIGAPLLIRSTRNVMLTKEGEHFMRGMEDIRKSLLDLERNIEHERSALDGVLRITAPMLFSDRYLLDICHAFHEKHPGISFSIDCSYTSHNLAQSHYDLAFRATNTPPQNMVAKALLPYKHVCVAAPSYLDKHGRPKTPQELEKHQCLHAPEQNFWQFKSQEVSTHGWVTINDNHALKREALAGRGIIRLPDYVTEQEVNEGTLEKILTDECIYGQTIYIVHPQTIHQSARLRTFINFTQEWFSEVKPSSDTIQDRLERMATPAFS